MGLGKNKNIETFRVSRIFGAYYEIYNSKHGRVLARLRGQLRLQLGKERSPVAVGDLVQAVCKSGNWIIESRLPRKSYIIRQSTLRDTHVLCANADYAALVASFKEPETKPGFIDRFLVSVSNSGMEPILIYNKKDLATKEEVDEKINFYTHLGYKIFITSIHDTSSIQKFKEFILGKVCFLCGNSGAGKSTLVNYIVGKEIQQIGEISHSTHKGKHTTTNPTAIFLEDGTVLIDSPGIKEWGLLHLNPEQIILGFPEFAYIQKKCKEENCCTLDESCPIQRNWDTLPEARKESLESMLKSLKKPFRTTRRDYWNAKEKSITNDHL